MKKDASSSPVSEPARCQDSFVVEPAPPPSLLAALGGGTAGAHKLQRFAELLAKEGSQLGLIGPRELPRVWSRHLLNSALLAPLLRSPAVDVGSGGGLPGLVLAICRPEAQITLVECRRLRSEWLKRMVSELELKNVTVAPMRVEQMDTDSFQWVTARALGPISRIIPWLAPLLQLGGELCLLKGAAVRDEWSDAAALLHEYRLEQARVEEVGLPSAALISAAGTVFHKTEKITVFRAVRR